MSHVRSSTRLCRHCETYVVSRSRGLCHRCYYRREIRDLYPAQWTPREETMEDLDRLVAERLPTMPKR